MVQDKNQLGDRTTLQQREASADVFEDGQNRSIDGPIRPMKDGEPYVYGDNRPDDREDRGGFVNFENSPEEFIHREEMFEAPVGDAEFVPKNLETRPRHRPEDPEGAEETVLVEKEVL